MKNAILILSFALLSAAAAGQTDTLDKQPENLSVQRAAISADRSRLEADFLTEDAACYKKFAVNSCLSKVNTRRRAAIAELRRQEILLNDEERRLKGEEQIRRTQDKLSPEKQQEAADRRVKSVQENQGRLKRENERQGERATAQSNEKDALQSYDRKLLDHQKKSQARVDTEAAAADEARKFHERQKKAQERLAEHETDQLGRVKPSAKSLPLPE